MWRFRSFRDFSGALAGLSGLQAGYLNSSDPKDSIRIDLRPKMWQSTSIVVCFGLVLKKPVLFGQSEFFAKVKKIDSDGTLLWLRRPRRCVHRRRTRS